MSSNQHEVVLLRILRALAAAAGAALLLASAACGGVRRSASFAPAPAAAASAVGRASTTAPSASEPAASPTWDVTGTVTPVLHSAPHPGLGATTVTFADARHGWALSGCGKAGCTVIGTTDGGQTWASVGSIPLREASLQFLGDRTGFATTVCSSNPCPATTVLATADGGATWQVRSSGTEALADVDFLTADTGWAVAGSGLVRTADGGRTWTAVPAPVPTGCTLRTLDFATAADGWAGGDGPCLLHTADGGRTWSAVFTSAAAPVLAPVLTAWSRGDRAHDLAGVAANMAANCGVAPHFQSPNTGWLAVSCGSYYTGGVLVARTGDGGRSWQYAWGIQSCLMGCHSIGGGYQPLFFLGDGQTAWREGPVGTPGLSCGTIQRTTDGGQTWDAVGTSCTDVPPAALAFVDADRGFLTEGSGIFATSDGGAHWARVYPAPTGGPFAAVDFVSAGQGFAVPVAAQGEVQSSADGGTTWQAVYDFGPAVTLSGVNFTDTVHGWAWGLGGSDPLVYATANGGRTWVSAGAPVRTLPTQGVLANADSGWLIAGNGSLWSTTDGGSRWTPAPSPPGGAMQRLGLAGPALAWALTVPRGASNGPYTLWSTTDGGAHWTKTAEYPKQFPPPVLTFTSPRDGWAADQTSLLRTNDGGRTWTRVAWSVQVKDLAFVDAAHGWVLMSDGSLWTTADAGATWFEKG